MMVISPSTVRVVNETIMDVLFLLGNMTFSNCDPSAVVPRLVASAAGSVTIGGRLAVVHGGELYTRAWFKRP
jgi:hypothetical protein